MNKIQLYVLGFILIFALSSGQAQVDTSEQHDDKLIEQIREPERSIDLPDSELQDHGSQFSVSVRSRVYQQLQQSSGFGKGTYLGSRLKSYQRILFKRGDHLSGGILFTKDAGEERLNDFNSMSLSINDVGFFSNIILGDYRIEAGQGIALWRGYGFSKGADVVAPVYRKARGLVSSISSDEVEYFRGFAVQAHIGMFDAALFYSRRRQSATLDPFGNITSLYASGYYRTESEQEKRDALTEQLFGVRGIYHAGDRKQLGFTFYRSLFSSPLMLDGGKLFDGNNFSLMSMDYDFTFQPITFFGEWTYVNKSIGGLSGILLKPSGTVSLVLAYRSYPSTFFSYHGLGFAERSGMNNEQGWYLGTDLRLSEAITLAIYFDRFRFPERTFSSKFPSHGYDMLAELEVQFTKHLIGRVRYRRKVSETSQSLLDRQKDQHVRFEMEYHIYKGIRLRSRFEKIFLETASYHTEQSFGMYHDIILSVSDRFRTNIRVAFFDTDSYDTRVIFLERDLEGTLTLPVLYGSGVRWYLLTQYSFNNRLKISMKYSDIIRDDVRHLGSGLDELPTNHDNRLGVQVDLEVK